MDGQKKWRRNKTDGAARRRSIKKDGLKGNRQLQKSNIFKYPILRKREGKMPVWEC